MQTATQTEELIGTMLDGGMDDGAMAHALLSMTDEGTNSETIVGAARAVMARALPFEAPPDSIDVCGTGGDGKQTYNISTAVAFVVAACDVPVVKHGNRGVSSRSGSSDVLGALGLPSGLSVDFWQRMVAQHKIAFLFAPHFHPGLARLAPVRRALGTRTIFNVLGPLCNPAGVKRQLMGVYSPSLVSIIADVMQARGMESAWVVHGHDGGDELSIAGESHVAMVDRQSNARSIIAPEHAGLQRMDADALTGGTPENNAKALSEALSGTKGAYREAIILNAAAALVVAGAENDLALAAKQATQAIDSGRALAIVSALQNAASKEHHV